MLRPNLNYLASVKLMTGKRHLYSSKIVGTGCDRLLSSAEKSNNFIHNFFIAQSISILILKSTVVEFSTPKYKKLKYSNWRRPKNAPATILFYQNYLSCFSHFMCWTNSTRMFEKTEFKLNATKVMSGRKPAIACVLLWVSFVSTEIFLKQILAQHLSVSQHW